MNFTSIDNHNQDLQTKSEVLDTTSESDDSDDTPSMDDADEEHYQDAQVVTNSFSGKRLLSSSSSSDNSDGSLTPGRKQGKRIQRRFESLFCQAEVVNQAVNIPLPVDGDDDDDDDDDDLTQDPTLNNPLDPNNNDKHTDMATDFDSLDYPLTQLIPIRKISKAASQPTDLLSPFVRKSTCPQPIVGTSRVLRSQSQTLDKSTK